MTMPLIAYPYDYLRVEAAVMEWVPRWKGCGFDGVVAIARGGLVAATVASTTLDLPLFAVSYTRGTRAVQWFTTQRPAANARLLLVEDIAGRGTTFVDCAAFLRGQGFDIQTFALAHDSQSRIVPDYGHKVPDGYRAWFPWERESITPAFDATGNRPDRPLYDYASWAIDLDGVLLPDIPAELYRLDLPAALEQRHSLPPAATVPSMAGLDLSSATIITGRLESDRQATQAWLDQYGYHGPLVMRDGGRHAVEDTARHKAEAIATRGHTHFIESDAAQSIKIANQLKVARIFWWTGSAAVAVTANTVAASPPTAP
jgi:hypoxanthine phosphoribosyltransferase